MMLENIKRIVEVSEYFLVVRAILEACQRVGRVA